MFYIQRMTDEWYYRGRGVFSNDFSKRLRYPIRALARDALYLLHDQATEERFACRILSDRVGVHKSFEQIVAVMMWSKRTGNMIAFYYETVNSARCKIVYGHAVKVDEAQASVYNLISRTIDIYGFRNVIVADAEGYIPHPYAEPDE